MKEVGVTGDGIAAYSIEILLVDDIVRPRMHQTCNMARETLGIHLVAVELSPIQTGSDFFHQLGFINEKTHRRS